jgi:HlyD family secretion protein
MKKRVAILTLLIAVGVFVANTAMRKRVEPPPVVQAKAPDLIAAAGRVEPVSEEIKVGAELNGKLRSVPVEEGDRVRRGQVIAILENSDYAARVDIAKAALAQREAGLRRVQNGARPEEKLEAEASVNEARAVLDNARAELSRREALFRSGDIARADLDRAEREVGVARARYDAALQRKAVAENASRVEDKDSARADVEYARAQLTEARARLEKTVVRSPIDGVVLRKHLKAGETVSDQADNVIVTLGDDSTLRIRADVDETDVAKIVVGQPAFVKAEAYGSREFRGKVVRVSQILGKKNIRTDEPTERVDTKILETLIELNPGERLPAGLRVDAYIEPAKPASR